MASKARKTSDVFDEQDALARAYKSPAEPVREKERLADVWVVEGTLRENQPNATVHQQPIPVRSKTQTPVRLYEAGETGSKKRVHQKPIRVRSKPKKHAKLYLLKKGNNNVN